MINIILFLVFIACISLSATFIADNPGYVSMVWFDYQIETSVAFIIFVTVICSVLFMLFTMLIMNLVTAPKKFFERRHSKQLRSGISELTYSISALASYNIDAAEKHVKKTEKLIGKTPLTILLSAQISKHRGDDKNAQLLLEKLLDYKETEYLAACSLSDSANKQENLPKALQLAKTAQKIHPKNTVSCLAVISLQVRMQQWSEALNNIQRSKLAHREKNRIKALIEMSYGEVLLNEQRFEEAYSLAKNVIYHLPNFAPAISFTALVYNKNNLAGKAIRLLINAYKKNPSQLLKDTFEEIIVNEPYDAKEKLRKKLSSDIVDGIWNCKNCGHKQIKWKIHCDNCASFDSLVWK